MDTYSIIIEISIVVVLSFLFNLFAKKTNFPSVFLLISLGLVIKVFFSSIPEQLNLMPVLEFIGVIGLIMIVLEAALDLELKREKRSLILKSMIIALLGLIFSSLLIAFVLKAFIPNIDYLTSIIYAIPLSIMSSAIIIPSVVNLNENVREFMIYESTFSDIFGIMLFYYILDNVNANGFQEIALNVSGNLITTILISLVLGYFLVWALQALKTRTKFFLILAFLLLLYAIGKLMHISSLLIILIFGLILNNQSLFFRGKMSKLISNRGIYRLLDDFKLFTAETAFLVRTFFFVFFGMSLSLDALAGFDVWLISFIVLVLIFGIRFLLFSIIRPKNMYPESWISPRGLISILLFYAIPDEFQINDFETGILFVIIIATSFIMAFSLMLEKKNSGIHGNADEATMPLDQ